jgi:hypothetical protein
MARINTYEADTNITDGDKVIGTDSSGNVTKNFRLGAIADWMTKYGKIGVAGQSVFIIQTDYGDNGREDGTVSLETFGGNLKPFSEISELVVSKYTSDLTDASVLLDGMVGSKIILQRLDQSQNFGIYNFATFEPHPVEPNFFVATLSLVQSSGVLLTEQPLAIGLYSGGTDDKYYTHDQTVASIVWTINHNLGKRPSVSVTDSFGTTVYGQVEYQSDNALTITFKAAFKGKAYLN